MPLPRVRPVVTTRTAFGVRGGCCSPPPGRAPHQAGNCHGPATSARPPRSPAVGVAADTRLLHAHGQATGTGRPSEPPSAAGECARHGTVAASLQTDAAPLLSGRTGALRRGRRVGGRARRRVSPTPGTLAPEATALPERSKDFAPRLHTLVFARDLSQLFGQ